MGRYVQQLVTVTDGYTEFPCPGTEYVNVQVFTAGVDIEYGIGFPAPVYGPFPEYLALTGFAGNRQCDAIRFKNHVAGTPAQIQITAQGRDQYPLGVPQGDSFSPNFLSLSPSGAVNATFQGNVNVTEGETATSGVGGIAASVIGWISTLTGNVQAFLQAIHNSSPIPFSGHNFYMRVLNDAGTGSATIDLYADSGPTSTVTASANDGTNSASVKIIDAKGVSDFTRSAATISYPARAVNTAYTPNANRPTMVVCSVRLTLPAVSTVTAELLINGTQSANIISQNLNAAGITIVVPVTFFVPAGDTYEILDVGGAVGIDITMEMTL